jgi:CHAD domain-containing protein
MRATFAAAFEPLPSVLRGDDTRPVHDMRVALRRLRTGLKTFESCFPRDRLRIVRRDVRRIARRLGAVRDADVHLAALRAALGGATESDRPGIAYAIDEISTRRRAALAAFAIELSGIDRHAAAGVLSDV